MPCKGLQTSVYWLSFHLQQMCKWTYTYMICRSWKAENGSIDGKYVNCSTVVSNTLNVVFTAKFIYLSIYRQWPNSPYLRGVAHSWQTPSHIHTHTSTNFFITIFLVQRVQGVTRCTLPDIHFIAWKTYILMSAGMHRNIKSDVLNEI